MKLSDIQDLWDIDCEIDRTNLDIVAIDIAKLHQKYYKILLTEKTVYKLLYADYNKLLLDKHEYYLNGPTAEDARKNPDKVVRRKVLKSDVDLYLNADSDVIALKLKLEQQKDKITYLEEIIKMISNRGFAIKNAIDWQKFINATL